MIPLTMLQRLARSVPNATKAYLKKKVAETVYIYSNEWGAYWRPNSCGYTTDVNEAGEYSLTEAFHNTNHCGPEKQIFFKLKDDKCKGNS